MPELVLRLHRQWTVKCPPCKKHMVGGNFVPTVKGAFRGRNMKRLVTIELHKIDKSENSQDPFLIDESFDNDNNNNNNTKSGRKSLSRSTTTTTKTNDLASQLHDEDRIIVRIMKPRKSWGLMKDPSDDDSSSSDEDFNPSSRNSPDEFAQWIEYRRYDLDEIDDIELSKASWEATVGRASNMERRELRFDSAEQATDFQTELENLRQQVKEHSAARLKAYQLTQSNRETKMKESFKLAKKKQKEAAAKVRAASGDTPKSTSRKRSTVRGASTKAIVKEGEEEDEFDELSPDSSINLLVEVVSAMDLPIADVKSTDPYVVVFMGKQEVHRTKTISKDLNPIWTVDNGSLFILSQTAEEFFSAASGLTFFVKDYDGMSKNETVGKVEIPQTDLLGMAGERIECDLQVMGQFKSKTRYFKPKLMIRVRPARLPDDFQFLKQLHSIKKSKKLGVYADQSFVKPVVESTKLLKKEKKVVDGVKKNRVKPRPDPSRAEAETKWMTKEEINEEILKPSTRWIAAGSGALGKLYMEVLKCDNLPNMDVGVEGLTDAYCCIIYEDAIVNTDVINDELSPRWVPWSQRAFVFNIQHPSSQILLGVVDFDSEKGLNTHDAIGRVTIDITNFAPDTDYTLTFDLHASVMDEIRPKLGTVTIRLRIEYDDYRDFVMGSLAVPPLNYINVAKKNDFLTSYFVCCGEENLQKLDIEAIGSYKTELEEYLDLIYYIGDALLTILLWRGHYQLKVFGQTVWLPLHSIVAFWMATRLIDNFNYLPSFTFFCIAWFFLATNEQRQRNPSPWHGTLTFWQMWFALIRNKHAPSRIMDNEDEAKIRKYEEQIQKLKEERKSNRLLAAETDGKLVTFMEEEEQAANAEAIEGIESKVHKGGSLIPFAKFLLPIQSLLGSACVALRVVSSIVTWDESIFAFLIVNACLALGIALIWVPWGFIVRWTLRILIWILLGPWMKLVDIYYVQKLSEEGDNEAKRFNEMASSKLMTINATRQALMMQKEDMAKLRDMKRYMFGKFITRCPQFKEYRYPDIPKPESTAFPRERKSNEVHNIVEKKCGQRLDGPMIPIWGDAIDATDEDESVQAPETIATDEAPKE